MESRDQTAFALALLRMEKVGRVTASRLFARFPTLAELRSTPREQVLVHLKGLPSAGEIVTRLFSDEAERLLEQARRAVDVLAQRQIQVLSSRHQQWPQGLQDMERRERPVVLYIYGNADILSRPSIALLAQRQLEPEPFEAAQTLTRMALREGCVPIGGLQYGFDTVLSKLAVAANAPAAAVASAGLARVPGPMRPPAAAMVRAGGALLSPFDPEHGPYPHDDVERAQVAAALAGVTVVIGAVPGSPEERAAEWAREMDRPVFDLRKMNGDERMLREIIAAARAGIAGEA